MFSAITNALHNLGRRTKKYFGWGGEDFPKYDFPDNLDQFGFHFNDNGELVDENGGKFQFHALESNHNYNQQRYEALGELVTDYIYGVLEKNLSLKRVVVPIDAKETEPHSFFFMSKDADQKDKLMVLIHGAGVVRAGQWSRKLIINENIHTGSQLPYIKRALDESYGVIVLNSNLNEAVVNGKHGKPVVIRDNATPEEHGIYVWQNFVLSAKAQNIVIVAHSFGGIVTCSLAERFLEDFKKRVFCIVFTDSVHTADRNQWSQPVKEFMKERAVNFASSYLPLNTSLDSSDPSDCQSVSAGTEEHERTSHSCFEKAFEFIRDNYETWVRLGKMAPRRFLPLPADLTQYSPEAKWRKMHDGETAEDNTANKEQETTKIKGASSDEESASKNGGGKGEPEIDKTDESAKDGESISDISTKASAYINKGNVSPGDEKGTSGIGEQQESVSQDTEQSVLKPDDGKAARSIVENEEQASHSQQDGGSENNQQSNEVTNAREVSAQTEKRHPQSEL